MEHSPESPRLSRVPKQVQVTILDANGLTHQEMTDRIHSIFAGYDIMISYIDPDAGLRFSRRTGNEMERDIRHG
jgi:hypothetical protein